MKKTKINRFIKKTFYSDKPFRIVDSKIINGKIIFKKHYKTI